MLAFLSGACLTRRLCSVLDVVDCLQSGYGQLIQAAAGRACRGDHQHPPFLPQPRHENRVRRPRHGSPCYRYLAGALRCQRGDCYCRWLLHPHLFHLQGASRVASALPFHPVQSTITVSIALRRDSDALAQPVFC